MAGCPADDGSQADDGIVFARFCHLLGNEGNFKGTGNPGCRNVIISHAVTFQRIIGAAEKTAADEFIETGNDNPYFNTRNLLIYLLYLYHSYHSP